MRLINADKYLKETCTYKDTGCGSCIFQGKCIADEPTVFELPDNPTNGDMIKAMFQNAENIRVDGGYPLNYIIEGERHRNLKEWWNSPYERR